jgi:hypothetical protein
VPKLRQIAFVYELFAKEIKKHHAHVRLGFSHLRRRRRRRRRRIKNSYLNFSISITNEFTI